MDNNDELSPKFNEFEKISGNVQQLNDELRKIEALNFHKVKAYLSDSKFTVESLVSETRQGSILTTSSSSTLMASPDITTKTTTTTTRSPKARAEPRSSTTLTAAKFGFSSKKSARIANSTSRYRKLLITKSKKTKSSGTTTAKIKLGFSLVMNKNRNRTNLGPSRSSESIDKLDEIEASEKEMSLSPLLKQSPSISPNEFKKHKSLELHLPQQISLNKSLESLSVGENKLQVSIEMNDEENENENSFNDINNNSNNNNNPKRNGPRVKHVSRYPVSYLNQVDNVINQIEQKKYYHELKSINQDFSPLLINWRSFTSDLENNFILSALPTRLKDKIIEKLQFRSVFSDSLAKIYFHANEISNESTTTIQTNEPHLTNNKQQRHLPSSNSKTNLFLKRTTSTNSTTTHQDSNAASQKHTTTIQFDWEDYFEKNHKISSNQNFRFSSLTESASSSGVFMTANSYRKAALNDPTGSSSDNRSFQAVNSTTSGGGPIATKSAKRLAYKLNSYKDNRCPYGIDASNGDFISNSISNVGVQLSAGNTLATTSSNVQMSNGSGHSLLTRNENNQSDFGLESGGYLKYRELNKENYVWDNNIVNSISELYEQGYSLVSSKPFILKSICFLCGSGPELESQLNYCSVCCQAFHDFCLKDTEKPEKNTSDLNWVCPNCKYCEICFLPENLLSCDKCCENYHPDCVKKSYYPSKHSKNCKIWLCRKCFECKICKSRNMFYEKKLFNKMSSYNFSTCLKCYEKYKLEKPLRCCNSFISSHESTSKSEMERHIFECQKCFNWIHYSCLQLPAQDIDILRNNTQLLSCLECNICDTGLNNIGQKLAQIKEIIFKEIFCHMDLNQVNLETLLSSAWQENSASLESVTDLCAMIKKFYNSLKNQLNDQTQIKHNLEEAIQKKYPYLTTYLDRIETEQKNVITKVEANESEGTIKMEENDRVDEQNKIEIDTMEAIEREVDKTLENDDIDKTITKDQSQPQNIYPVYESLLTNLVKLPSEDHIYAISDNSLKAILESNNKFLIDTVKIEEAYKNYEKLDSNEKEAYLKNFQQNLVAKSRELNELETDEPFENVKRGCIDDRECVSCHILGDHKLCGRLIPVDSNWIHVNCLLFADGFSDDLSGIQQLQNLFAKQKTVCCHCNKEGALMTCQNLSCQLSYHLNCACLANCYIDDKPLSDIEIVKDKKSSKSLPNYYFYCSNHTTNLSQLNDSRLVFTQKPKSVIIEPRELREELIRRKIPTQRHFPKTTSERSPRIQIGSLQIENLGDLETISDFKEYLCPINFVSSRLFWSTKEVGKKCIYKCRIIHINDFKSFMSRTNLNKLNTTDKIVIIDDDDGIEQKFTSMLIEKEVLSELAQLDGQNDNLDDPVKTGINMPPQNKGIIRLSNLNVNGGLKFFQKVTSPSLGNPIQTDLEASSAKKLTNQTLLNSLSTQSMATNEKPKVLKMDPLRFPTLKTPFINLEKTHTTFSPSNTLNLSNPMRNQPPPPSIFVPKNKSKSKIQNSSEHFTSASSSSFASSSYLNINTNPDLNKHNQLTMYQNQSNEMYLNLVSPKSDKSDSSLNLNHSSFLNPMSQIPMGFDTASDSSPFSGVFNFKSQKADNNNENNNSISKISKTNKTNKINNNISNKNTIGSSQVETNEKPKQASKTKKEKSGSGKKCKRIEGEPKPNKCTVATLLSQLKREKVADVVESQPLFFPTSPKIESTNTETNSNIVNFEKESNVEIFLKSPSKKKGSSARKYGNKLRDYFGSKSSKEKVEQEGVNQNQSSNGIEANMLENSVIANSNDKTEDFNRLKAKKGTKKKKSKLFENEVLVATKKFKYSHEPIATDYGTNGCYSIPSQLVYEITSEDGLRVISYDINQAWKAIFDKVKTIRQQHKLKGHYNKSLNGVKMYGLNYRSVLFMLEQNNSIEFCPIYKCKYIQNENLNDKWVVNVNNCARTTQRYENGRKWPDRFYWLTSEHRNLNLNFSQRFDQAFFQSTKSLTSLDMCNSMKYRHLKEFSKNALIVKRSHIHGRGLFTLVDLQQSQMIIEYAGEIIRHELCDKREKYYESKGIGCYMFRIDEFEVIDATTKGNQARFINHSCDPNCISRVLLIQGHKHIVIFAQRLINRGEELTYDYKFPKEDDKIKCLCKSSKCRKYLN